MASEAPTTSQRSAAVLPRSARPPFRVWLNSVEQVEGRDYQVEGNRLIFDRPLAKEGRLGVWNWTMLLLGVRGTYRKNDSVDVQYETASGETRLATRVDFEPVSDV
jgi:hypothetical protein